MRRSNHLHAIIIVFALLVAACGGDDTTETTAPADPTVATTLAPTGETTTSEPADSPVPTLAGTSWKVTDYGMEDGALTNVLSGTEVTIVFGQDGSVSGSTGCNEYTGSYEVQGPYDEFEDGVRDDNDGQAIQISSISATERACEGGFVMEQEADHIRNLLGAQKWFIARGGLILRGDGAYIEAVPG